MKPKAPAPARPAERDQLRIAVAVLIAVVTLLHVRTAASEVLNVDEALHYSLANQLSVREAWLANNTNAHPPLLIVLLYFWRKIGTSELFLRLIPILSNAAFLWFGFGWARATLGPPAAASFTVLLALLPRLFGMAGELRQYMPMLGGIAIALYFFEQAWRGRTVRNLAISAAGLLVAILSNYSATWFAAGFGCYGIVRLSRDPLPKPAPAIWAAGQAVAAVVYAILYSTHIRELAASNVSQDAKLGWLRSLYRLPGDDSLSFIFQNTGRVLRYTFGSPAMAWIGGLLILAGLFLLATKARAKHGLAVLTFVGTAFLVALGGALAGLFPYGGSRHSLLLGVVFAIPAAVACSWFLRGRATLIAAIPALLFGVIAHSAAEKEFFELEGAARSRQHLVEAVDHLRQTVPPGGLLFVDMQTSHLLCYYFDPSARCAGDWSRPLIEYKLGHMRVVMSRTWATYPDRFVQELAVLKQQYGLPRGAEVWAMSAGWGTPLHEMLQVQFAGSSLPSLRVFGGHASVFRIPN